MTEEKKHFSKLGWIVLIGSLLIFGLQWLVSAVLAKIRPEWMQDPNLNILAMMLTMYLLGMPVMIFLLKRLPAVKPQRHAMKPGQFAVAAIMCYALMYIANLLGTWIAVIISFFTGNTASNPVMDLVSDINPAILFVFTVLCAPIYEEFIFRKLIVDATMRYGQGVAIVLSGLMFGLFHGNLNQFIYAFALGVFFAFLYIRTGDIRVTIGLHMIVNFIGTVAGMMLLKMIPLDEMYELMETGAYSELMRLYLNHMGQFMGLAFYVVALMCVVIAGVVLWILYRDRFRLMQVQGALPKGERFRTVALNPGMILFVVFWVFQIVMGIFMA